MLRSFDWIRLCATGAELLATLEYLAAAPDLFDAGMDLGPAFSARAGPCQRCWIYAPAAETAVRDAAPPAVRYCPACRLITARTGVVSGDSRRAIVIWGYVNQLPRHVQTGEGFYERQILGKYCHDRQRFLLVLPRRNLQPWLQELAIAHGPDLKGHLQIFPTTGGGRGIAMGALVCRAAHHEARFPLDCLRVRFYTAPHQLLRPHARDAQGLLTFEAAEFLGLLEMATVFRTMIRPNEQQMLYDLLHLQNPTEKQFYWGRFMGYLDQPAKDMLNAWNVRQWPENRITLLYELLEYVDFDRTA